MINKSFSVIATVLIDTWWNVNQEFVDSLLQLSGFNRYMVECEFNIGFFCDNKSDVLIDTWWNVNIKFVTHCAAALTVLIDTWWNVNIPIARDSKLKQASFNRYMVECELLQSRIKQCPLYRFNRYMVECE